MTDPEQKSQLETASHVQRQHDPPITQFADRVAQDNPLGTILLMIIGAGSLISWGAKTVLAYMIKKDIQESEISQKLIQHTLEQNAELMRAISEIRRETDQKRIEIRSSLDNLAEKQHEELSELSAKLSQLIQDLSTIVCERN